MKSFDRGQVKSDQLKVKLSQVLDFQVHVLLHCISNQLKQIQFKIEVEQSSE